MKAIGTAFALAVIFTVAIKPAIADDIDERIGHYRSAVQGALATYRNTGMSGLRSAVGSCYQNLPAHGVRCYYMDYTARLLDVYMSKAGGFPRDKYFMLKPFKVRREKLFNYLRLDDYTRRMYIAHSEQMLDRMIVIEMGKY